MEDEKRRLLTQTSPIPPEMLHQLSTDGGMEGIKNMMRSDGWDGDSPIILAVHRLDAAASLSGSKWSLQGKVAPVPIKAKRLWPGVTTEDIFLTIKCDDLEMFL